MMDGAAKGIRETIGNLLEMNSTNFLSDGPYHCPVCGTFIPKRELPLRNKKGDPILVQPACSCVVKAKEAEIAAFEKAGERREIERKFARHTMGARVAAARFEDYIERDGSETAYAYAKRYAEHFADYSGDSLLLWGPYGNGKTFLAGCVANYLHERGEIVIFQSLPDLLERVRSTFDKSNPDTEHDIISALLRCDLLILDDIGAEQLRKRGVSGEEISWAEDLMYRIIDGRYRHNRPILYTSNLEPARLSEKIGDRIYDRILETTVAVQNQATSYRREIANNRYKDKRWQQD